MDLTAKGKIMVTSHVIISDTLFTQQIFRGVHSKGHSANVNLQFVVAEVPRSELSKLFPGHTERHCEEFTFFQDLNGNVGIELANNNYTRVCCVSSWRTTEQLEFGTLRFL